MPQVSTTTVHSTPVRIHQFTDTANYAYAHTLITVNYRLTNVRDLLCTRRTQVFVSHSLSSTIVCRGKIVLLHEPTLDWFITLLLLPSLRSKNSISQQPWLVIKSGFKANKALSRLDHQCLSLPLFTIVYWCTSNWVIDHCTCLTEMSNDLVVTVFVRRLLEQATEQKNAANVPMFRMARLGKPSLAFSLSLSDIAVEVVHCLSKLTLWDCFVSARESRSRRSRQWLFFVVTGANRSKAGGTSLFFSWAAQLLACAVTHGHYYSTSTTTPALSSQFQSQGTFWTTKK